MNMQDLQVLLQVLQQHGVVNYKTPEIELQIMPRYNEPIGKIRHETPEEKLAQKGAEMPLSMSMWSTK